MVQYAREVCSATLLSQDIKLGGDGKIVEIDESLFVKPKNNRGRNAVKIIDQLGIDCPSGNFDKWVFAFYDPQLKIGYMELVPNRNHETLGYY